MARGPIADLVRQLVAMPSEAEWVEFKHNNDDPEEIGKQISALSNAAALHGREGAFLVWGVHDETHEIVGTAFRPREKRVGASELENWLATQLHPQVHFSITECEIDGCHVVVFEIEPASYSPIAFKGEEWIRVGTYTKPLRRHVEKERALWKSFGRQVFETGIAAYGLSMEAVGNLINYRDYFTLAKKDVPPLAEAAPRLLHGKILTTDVDDKFNITNLGALLLAKDIRRFETIRRKTMRVVFYKGISRTETFMEKEGRRGYATGFRGLVGYLMSQLPHSEEIKKALRVELPMYPEIAIRELVANALVHQDFEIGGACPMVEVFRDRVEITNPGTPLNDIQRLLDLPARSRNEKLAQLMKRLKVCEERGSGIDKVLTTVEAFQLPAPDFQIVGDNMRAILFSPRPFAEMTKNDRMRACYQHAGLQHVSNRQMTNETLRTRFGFAEDQSVQASRVITDTLAASLIKQYDPSNTSKRHARYIPFWA